MALLKRWKCEYEPKKKTDMLARADKQNILFTSDANIPVW